MRRVSRGRGAEDEEWPWACEVAAVVASVVCVLGMVWELFAEAAETPLV